eukprot:SAG11_NODE_895_length_6641_cov_6.653928_6_plen_167_part_00
MNEVHDSHAMDMQAVKLLATYLAPGLRDTGMSRLYPHALLQAPVTHRSVPPWCQELDSRPATVPILAALVTLTALMEDPSASTNPTLQLMAGYIYSYEQEYEKALRAVHSGYTLEQYAPAETPPDAVQPPAEPFVPSLRYGVAHCPLSQVGAPNPDPSENRPRRRC